MKYLTEIAFFVQFCNFKDFAKIHHYSLRFDEDNSMKTTAFCIIAIILSDCCRQTKSLRKQKPPLMI